MNTKNDLTEGNIGKTLIIFAFPYLISCFLQTFYGMADLYVVGLYNPSETTTAVSVGSQITHMLTVIIVGLAMGSTVKIANSAGAKNIKEIKRTIVNTLLFFCFFAICLTVVLMLSTEKITDLMMTPKEAVKETNVYLIICFAGIPFIVAYNVISSIFRGLGNSKLPMYFVGIACIVNIIFDFIFIGYFRMGAAGAALGTICGQAVSVVISIAVMKKQNFGFSLKRNDICINRRVMSAILKVGVPIAMQDGLIQVAFVIITVIANSRGLIFSAGVGIVEKIISFMFLVPSAFLSAISAITAQNIGADKPFRAKKSLKYGLIITVSWGLVCFIYCQFLPQTLVGMFTLDSKVLSAGSLYLKAYSLDCVFAAIHFCFSGYFCGRQKSGISFIHNILAIIIIRIPGAYLASKIYSNTLYPMGLAAPLGSLLSSVICIIFYIYYERELKRSGKKW